MKKVFLYKQKICYRCKSKSNPDSPLTNSGGGVKGKYQYKICRKCNTLKLKKYRLTKNGKISTNRAVKKSTLKYYKKHLARVRLHYHLKVGHIIKSEKCKCGSKKVEAHHADYNFPLAVKWLCRGCHANLHRKMLVVLLNKQ